jgi:hypothetical protein
VHALEPILTQGLDPSKRRGQAYGPGEYSSMHCHVAAEYSGNQNPVLLVLSLKVDSFQQGYCYVTKNPSDFQSSYQLPVGYIRIIPNDTTTYVVQPTVEYDKIINQIEFLRQKKCIEAQIEFKNITQLEQAYSTAQRDQMWKAASQTNANNQTNMITFASTVDLSKISQIKQTTVEWKFSLNRSYFFSFSMGKTDQSVNVSLERLYQGYLLGYQPSILVQLEKNINLETFWKLQKHNSPNQNNQDKPKEFFYIIQLVTHNESKDYLYLVDFTHMTMTMAGTSFCLELERHEG